MYISFGNHKHEIHPDDQERVERYLIERLDDEYIKPFILSDHGFGSPISVNSTSVIINHER